MPWQSPCRRKRRYPLRTVTRPAGSSGDTPMGSAITDVVKEEPEPYVPVTVLHGLLDCNVTWRAGLLS